MLATVAAWNSQQRRFKRLKFRPPWRAPRRVRSSRLFRGAAVAATAMRPCESDRRCSPGASLMLRQVCEMADFIRRVRTQLRFGSLSRAPLQLLRLEVRADSAECEWMSRPADPWDLELPVVVRDRNLTDQALKDVIEVRRLLFSVLPQVLTVNIRVYRQFAAEPPELIIAGTVSRNEPSYG